MHWYYHHVRGTVKRIRYLSLSVCHNSNFTVYVVYKSQDREKNPVLRSRNHLIRFPGTFFPLCRLDPYILTFTNKIYNKLTFWTTKSKKFADFVAFFSWYAEFKNVQIFAISLSVSKICKIFVFRFFNSAQFFENHVYSNFYAEFISVGNFFRYLLPFKNESNKVFFNSAWPQYKAF